MCGTVGFFLFLENFDKSGWCTPFSLLRAGNRYLTVSHKDWKLFSSLVPPSKNGDLCPLTPPRARKIKTAPILLCNLHNVGICKNHINYP